jgi:hypothetical protein
MQGFSCPTAVCAIALPGVLTGTEFSFAPKC